MKKDTFNYNECRKRFDEWLEDTKGYLYKDLNETETRNKIIDPLFKYVLGWDEKQISREGHINKIGYYDYEFDSVSNKMIIEAKREFVPFVMPKTSSVKYNAIKDKLSHIGDAINQGVDYAASKKHKVVCVSNGVQLAVTYIPYINIKTYDDTLLFTDHKDLNEKFTTFWNLFSPIQNIENELPSLLVPNPKEALIRPRPSFRSKIGQQQESPEDVVEGNVLAEYFDKIHGRYFTEIISDPELLKMCYCDSESSHNYTKQIEFVLRDRAPRLGQVVQDVSEEAGESTIEQIETKKKSAGIFSRRFAYVRDDTKMFVLIGGPGAGKTTFIHRFFNYILSEEDRKSTVWLYLDCRKCTSEDNLDQYIYERLEDELYSKYEKIGVFDNQDILMRMFAKDLNKQKALINLLPSEEERNRERHKIIKDIISGNKHVYIERIFEYLKKQDYSTCVVYDNVDQLDANLQKKMFLHANAVRERFQTTVILSLREEIYYQYEHEKAFNFAECDVFHIPAPKIYSVLSKRLKAIKESKTTEDKFWVTTSKGVGINIAELDVIEVISQTFLGNEDNSLLLEMLSNRDIREALRKFKRIISSNNVNFDLLINAAGVNAASPKSREAESDKRFKTEELLRSLALGNRLHYNGSRSSVINIFDINNDGFFSHFTKSRILYYAQENLHFTRGLLPKGFVKIKDMYEECFKYTVNNIEEFTQICFYLQSQGALSNLKGNISSISTVDFVRLGPAGSYYINYLKGNPYYLSLVSIDTPISSESKMSRINELYVKSLIAGQVQKYKRFIDMANEFVLYLLESEKEEIEYLEKLKCPGLDHNIYRISKDINDSMKHFLSTVKTN